MRPTQGYGPSSSRQRDNGVRSGKTLAPKRSVDDIFSSSTFFSATSSYNPALRRNPSVGAPVARAGYPDYSFRPPEQQQKLSERTSSQQPTQNKFQWMKGELVGRGSHGKVYLGFNVTTGELLAVKQVEIPTTADDRRKADSEPQKNFVRLLREERETLKDLYHPNIVQYLGFEENPETVNIFLEYVSGGTIASSLQELGSFKEEVTKSFTRQILKGLSYLHSKGIIHRDLKSDNILISDSGICKISDFGISKKLEKSRTHTFKGTYNWMAPEMVRNEGYDLKVDIWSVGCIVLEMWTAKRPWHNENAFKVMIELNEKHVPPLPAGLVLSTLADNFNKICFELAPAQRPTASDLLKHPYLTPKAGWSFPGMDGIGSTNTDIIAEVEEMAEVLSQSFELGSSKNLDRTSSPALTMKSGTLETESLPRIPTPNPPRPISPPLVYIAPPPPRKLSSTQDIDTWPSTTRDRSTSNASVFENKESSQPQRKLGIHNPATVPDLTVLKKRDLPKPPKPELFTYHPPPLPDITAPTPYSNQLGPQTKYIPPSAASLSLPTKSHRMGPANLKDIMSQPPSINGTNEAYYTDGSSYTTSSRTASSLWQKPPPNVVSRSHSHSEPYRALSGKSTPNAPFRKLPPIPIQRFEPAESTTGPKRSPVFTGNARPNSRNVLEHMKVYFPNYDLDEPIVSSQMDSTFESHPEMATDTVLARRFTMKSIKTIAEEQIHRDGSSSDRRRQTMLWDGHIEEIKALR